MNERKEISGLTIRSLAFSLICTAIMLVLLQGLSNIAQRTSAYDIGKNQGWYMTYFVWGMYVQILFWFLIPLVLSRLFPRKYGFTPAELTFIFSVIAGIPFVAGAWTFGRTTLVQVAQCYQDKTLAPFIRKYLSSYFYPKGNEAALEGMITGGCPVMWDAWIVPLFWFILFFSALWLWFIFGSLILSDLFITEESLPFPSVTITEQTMNMVLGERAVLGERRKTIKKWSKTLILVGIVISFVYNLLSNSAYTWLPGTGPGTGGSIMPEWYIDVTALTNSPTVLDFNPYAVAIALLLPIDVVVSTFIAHIGIFMIYPQILVALGVPMYVAITDPNRNIIWSSIYPFWYGVLFGIALIPLITNYKFLIRSIKMAVHGGKGIESPRFAWGGWALTGLLAIALQLLAGIPLQLACVLLFGVGILYLAIARCAAEGGVWTLLLNWSIPNYSMHYFTHMLGVTVGGSKAELYNFAWLSFNLIDDDHNARWSTNPMIWSLESFKLGSLTQTKKKDVFIGRILGTIIPLIIILPFGLWFNYTFGEWPVTWGTADLAAYTLVEKGELWGILWGWPPVIPKTLENMPTLYAFIFAGFVFTFLLKMARVKIRRFFTYITPLGIIFAVNAGRPEWGHVTMFMPCIIAIITRLIIYRVGGARMYREKVIPFAVAIVIGQALFYFFATITRILIGLGYTWW